MPDNRCIIVGGGPAGVVLALLFARQGIPVVLLEMHKDFDRDFRGDTIHPSTLEIMDQLGLADGLLKLPHSKISKMTINTPDGPVTPVDLSRLKTRFPYIAFMPQVKFLEFIVEEARQYPNFQLVMAASVTSLIEEDGNVRGVRYHSEDGFHEVRALLTVGADGRFSKLRHLCQFEIDKTSPPMDVMWFRVSRKPTDDPSGARIRRGHLLVMLERGTQWQIGYLIPKGAYHTIRDGGLEALQHSIGEIAPQLSDRVGELTDWKQVALLSVESDCLRQWYRDGLLLIGDAAHVMSPVGGLGINYAIQDAVVAANVLSKPLKSGVVEVRDLAEVQKQREWPTRFIQKIQSSVQQRIVAGALDPNREFKLSAGFRLFLSIPWLRDLPAKALAFGVRRVRLQI